MSVYEQIVRGKKKKFAVLIDPDKVSGKALEKMASVCQHAAADFIFVGGSLLTRDLFDQCVQVLKNSCDRPLVLFPGNVLQISHRADAILFLSLLSGRNPELLIGRHVVAAPLLKDSPLEVIPTAYLLVDGGINTTVAYMSNTQPIPADKPEIAAATALAGEMLGMKLTYLDAGSGAINPVSAKMIEQVKKESGLPLIAGGGILTVHQAATAFDAGADLVVMGNKLEKNPEIAFELAEFTHKY
jgi:putative glycerol-1-phosphate prenyltransferase